MYAAILDERDAACSCQEMTVFDGYISNDIQRIVNHGDAGKTFAGHEYKGFAQGAITIDGDGRVCPNVEIPQRYRVQLVYDGEVCTVQPHELEQVELGQETHDLGAVISADDDSMTAATEYLDCFGETCIFRQRYQGRLLGQREDVTE